MTIHGIEPVGVPATCGHCDCCFAFGRGDEYCGHDRASAVKLFVDRDKAPPPVCPKRSKTEPPLPPVKGGGERAAVAVMEGE